MGGDAEVLLQESRIIWNRRACVIAGCPASADNCWRPGFQICNARGLLRSLFSKEDSCWWNLPRATMIWLYALFN